MTITDRPKIPRVVPMKVVIVRRERGVALSMDVCADNLVAGLKLSRPDWQITEIAPERWSNEKNLWQAGTGLRKYYERLWRHPYAVSRLEADIFHVIDHSNAHVAYWLKYKSGKVVVTCNDLVPLIYPEILEGQARFPALSMASWKYSIKGMNHADRVIAISSNTAQDVSQKISIPPEKVEVVPLGVEQYFCQLPSADIKAIRQKYIKSSQDFCLLNVGSNHQRKNIPTILRALAGLRDRGVPIRLWKAGDKFTPEQQSLIKSLDLESVITFIHKPDRDTVLELYNAADVLLAPSIYEGFGLTILEAMACGIPVISSNASSLPEVAGDAAILVDPMDVDAIVNAVCDLQKDSNLRHGYIQKGLARTKLFSWGKSVEKTIQIYEKLHANNSLVSQMQTANLVES
jgi:glycosyltransferase involved in cell wall biosynthesis